MATISSNKKTLINESVLSIANLTMLNKISSVLSILSFIISITTIAAGYAGYRYITSPQFEAMMMEKVMEGVSKILPNQIDKKMPKVTGPMLPMSNNMSDDSKWFWDYIKKSNKAQIEWETKGKWENVKKLD